MEAMIHFQGGQRINRCGLKPVKKPMILCRQIGEIRRPSPKNNEHTEPLYMFACMRNKITLKQVYSARILSPPKDV